MIELQILIMGLNTQILFIGFLLMIFLKHQEISNLFGRSQDSLFCIH